MTLPPIKWTASPNYSSRGGQKVRLIVTHDCEGSYAGSVAWFAMAKSQVSAHLVLRDDGKEATQMVAWGNKAWHACNVNPYSEGIEAAGYEAKGLYSSELGALADLVAWRLHVNGIPCQEATVSNNWTGFTEHGKLGALGGGHKDWTLDGDVWVSFVKQVEAAYSQGAPVSPPAPTPTPAPPSPPGYIPNPAPRTDETIGSIAWAQLRLNAIGAARPVLAVDGMEGPATERAIVAFQSLKGLYKDGILGPQTIKALAA
jgi:hypothetical protein